MEFYQSVLGGKLTMSTFADFHANENPSEAPKIMHVQLEAENGTMLMASDTPNSMEHHPGIDVSLSLSGDDQATLRGYWNKLSESGSVRIPLDKAPWGDTFGMCTDIFGAHWMVNIAGQTE